VMAQMTPDGIPFEFFIKGGFHGDLLGRRPG